MDRANINLLKKIENDYASYGTAAMFFARNPSNNKTGLLKENGCMLGIDNEDIREKLASQILNECGVPCAEIELFTDDQNNDYCFSYNVLEENENHINMSIGALNTERCANEEEIFLSYVKKYMNHIIALPGITKVDYESIKKRILSIILMDCIIDHYDRKLDNTKIVYNAKEKKYKPPIAYDYGTAFAPNSLQCGGVFFWVSNEEVLRGLFKSFPDYIKDTAANVIKALNEENLSQLFNQSYLDKIDKDGIKNQIIGRVNQLKKIYFKTYPNDLIKKELLDLKDYLTNQDEIENNKRL